MRSVRQTETDKGGG